MRRFLLSCWIALGLAGLFFESGALQAADPVDLKSLLVPVPGSERYLPGAGGARRDLPPGFAGANGSGLLTEGELIRAIQLDLPKRFPLKGEYRVQLLRPWATLPLPGQDFFCRVSANS